MNTDPTAPIYAGDDLPPEVGLTIKLCREEAEALMELLPAATSRQWTASPVPRPRWDTTERATGQHSDPVADTVADPRRLALRDTVQRSEKAIRDAAIALRAARRAMERALARYDGEAA